MSGVPNCSIASVCLLTGSDAVSICACVTRLPFTLIEPVLLNWRLCPIVSSFCCGMLSKTEAIVASGPNCVLISASTPSRFALRACNKSATGSLLLLS